MRSEERAERPGDGCPCVGAEEICGAPPLISEGRNEDERRTLRKPHCNPPLREPQLQNRK